MIGFSVPKTSQRVGCETPQVCPVTDDRLLRSQYLSARGMRNTTSLPVKGRSLSLFQILLSAWDAKHQLFYFSGINTETYFTLFQHSYVLLPNQFSDYACFNEGNGR